MESSARNIGLLGATSIGVGAIVGGGILALAGAAFSATGASAIVAFAINGFIAFLCALSFAEVAARFPFSGGTYAFAKRVLSVDAAFTVGWVVWFASIVAGVLYAIGFGKFAAVGIAQIWTHSPDWLVARTGPAILALLAIAAYTLSLCRRSTSSGNWINAGKLIAFAMLIAAGGWAISKKDPVAIGASFQPFFAEGFIGLVQAMAYSFIAMQGFGLIAAVGGNIRDPSRTIPRAMFLSLGLALLVYIPLLVIVIVVGVPSGETIQSISKKNPDTLVAIAAENYLGAFGYWLVLAAAILSTLSALQANLLAAAYVAKAMAADRNLPRRLAAVAANGSPRYAIILTAAITAIVVLVVPNVSAAGAASGLIFLLTYALTHWVAILVRQRTGSADLPFRTPFYPLVPTVGGIACLALAVYQGIAIPSAGIIATIWLLIGGALFLGLFATHARVADASLSGREPEAARMRGLNPLLLVPIANPDSARSMISLAQAIAPTGGGRVLLLSVMVRPPSWKPFENPRPVQAVQSVLGAAMTEAVEAGLNPESMATIGDRPWDEIKRVARVHRCESLLLGLSRLDDEAGSVDLDGLLNQVDCDVVVLRAPVHWTLSQAQKILVPLAGRGGHERLLARLLGSLGRKVDKHLHFLRVVTPSVPTAIQRRITIETERFCQVISHGVPKVDVVASESVEQEILTRAKDADLLILGSRRPKRGAPREIGAFAVDIARQTSCPLLVICHRR